jgi:Carboxypeptidase regulatory-like domain
MPSKVAAKLLGFAAILFLLGAASLIAQYTTGTVQGTVFDPSGAVIPNATVTLRNTETNATRSFKTGPDGIYVFPAVPPGPYEVSAEASGFARVAAQFAAVASQTVTQDMKLAVSGTATTVQVEVQAAAVQLDKTDPQLSTNRATLEVNDLPTQHSTIGLVGYSPGVQPMYNPRGGSLVKLSGAQTGQVSANGARAEYGNSELDFTDANDWEFGGFALGTQPTTDFIEEFKILTSNVSAEYGVKSGGEIMMITKSGSNNWHGEANDYIQNDFFNARNFNDTTGKAARTDINNYGFSTGGALIKDRTFLFGGWHQNRNIGAGATYLASVPTAAAIATVTDPGILSIIHSYLPTPTLGTSNPLIGIFPVNYSSPGKGYQLLLRGDHRFSDKNTLSARYFHSTANTVLPYVGSLVGLANEGALITSEARNANVTDTWLISPSVVNQLRMAYARSVGFLPPQMQNPGPYFTITGLLTFGEYGGFPQGRIFNIYQINDVISEAKGKHQLKEGFDIRDIQDNSYNTGTGQFFTRGYFTFPSESAFLTGQPSAYYQLFGPSAEPFRTKLLGFFAQDDYHVLPNLTVNIGLRWEFQGALTAAGGKFSLLDPTVPGSIGNAGSGPLGSFVVGNPIVHSNPFNIAPRVGFSWNPRAGHLVVRGGYGVFYNAFNFTPLADQGRTSPPVAYNAALTSFTGGNTISALLAGTSPFQQQWQTQAASGGFGTLTNFGSITTTNSHLGNSYLQQYNLSIEYQLPWSTLVSAGYVGSAGRHLAAFLPINSFLPSKLPAPAASVADETARLSAFQAAFAQEATGSLRPDTRFSQVNLITDAATSNFNSLQLLARKNFQHGVMFQASYTWSKSIDTASSAYPTQDYLGDGIPQFVNNLRLSRALSNFDIPHRFLLTGLYDLPLFTGRSDTPSRLLFRGWQIGFTMVYQSGVPMNIFSGPVLGISDVNLDGNTTGGSALDNTLANCNGIGTGVSLGHQFSSSYSYTQALLGQAGTCGRNIARQPGLFNLNSSLTKSFALFEHGPMGSGPWNLQLRWEVYNTVNNPSFYVASVNNLYVSNPTTFGQLTALSQRKMEMAIRLLW